MHVDDSAVKLQIGTAKPLEVLDLSSNKYCYLFIQCQKCARKLGNSLEFFGTTDKMLHVNNGLMSH